MPSDYLKELAEKFQQLRKEKKSPRYPTSLWLEVASLAKTHKPTKIAKALRIHPSYVYHKLKQLDKLPTFTPIQITPSSGEKHFSLQFSNADGSAFILSFQGELSQIPFLINALREKQ
jgi:hypothetical protein